MVNGNKRTELKGRSTKRNYISWKQGFDSHFKNGSGNGYNQDFG